MNNFVNTLINNLILSDNNWLFSSDFYKFGHFHNFFNNFLDLIYFGDFMFYCYNFILMNWYLDKSFLNCCDGDNFFPANFYLFYFLTYSWHYSLYFFDLFVNYDFLLDLRNLFYCSYLFNYLYAFFNLFRHLFNLLYFLLDHH